MLSLLGLALIIIGIKEMVSCSYEDMKQFLPGLIMVMFGTACLSAVGI